jgi:pimeloyl-ACP methyl ester carboxylesterase
LLHGINLSPQFWLTDSVFIEHGPCYALSLPGHEPAAFPGGFAAEALTAELIARVLTGAIRGLVGDRPVTLAGISTGGFAALDIAAHTPGIARRVVSISGFAQGTWTGGLGVYQWLVRRGWVGKLLVKGGFALGRRSRKAFRDQVWPYFVADRQAFYTYPQLEVLIDNIYPNWKTHDLDAVILYYIAMPNTDISALLPRITAPTLALTGDRDPVVPPAQSRLIAQSIPNAELAVIQGAGHVLFAERPAEYERAIDSWLRKTS